MSMRLRERRLFHRSRLLREVAAAAQRLRGRDFPDLAHLALYDELSWGPTQRDELLLLHALVRALRPRTIVEIGFLRGDSAFNFLRAADPETRVYSFDIDSDGPETARRRFGDDSRLVVRTCSQDSLTSADLDGRAADFVFLDGAHELGLNQAAFERIVPLLAPAAVVAVHDTGSIPRSLAPPGHWTLDRREQWAGDEYEHQPGDRAFVNWLLDAHPEFSQVHLHSRYVVRHGMTLLQKSAPLARPEGV